MSLNDKLEIKAINMKPNMITWVLEGKKSEGKLTKWQEFQLAPLGQTKAHKRYTEIEPKYHHQEIKS